VKRLGAITVLPFVPRPGDAATRVLIRGVKGSRAPFTLLASRALHLAGADGYTPELAAILAGEARLVW
jgi:tRNA1(Val) A37 N6-methylase TrmN6